MSMNFDQLSNCTDYVIFDLETTGLSYEKDAVIEISAIKISGGSVIDEFSTLVNPGMPIPYYATAVNGITDSMVKDAPFIEQALGDFICFIGSDPLLGHNIKSFDMKFIQRDSLRFFGRELDNQCIDTFRIAQRYLPDLGRHSLEALAYHYGVSYEGAHRALADCRINHQVYQCLLKEIENPSQAARQVEYCPRCGDLLRKRKGRFGEFLGCSNYPECRYTRDC